MTNQTTGQRIADCRKKLGLSQGALGEKVGVSQQAISKWEADAAMPDIDKLIFLSKLFCVSVGWLLGVEEQPEPQPEAPQLSEDLLHKIEAVVQQYQPKKPFPLWKKLVLGAAALALLWGGLNLYREWQYTRHQVSYLSGQLQSSSQQNRSILSQLNDLEDRIDSINDTIERESAALAAYEFQVKANPGGETASVYLNAIPKTWNESWTATLSVRYDGIQTVSQTCAWDGSALIGTLKLKLLNGYEYWLVIEYPDGGQEQVQLFHTAAENLLSSFTIECHVSRGKGYFSLKSGILALEGCVIHLAPPSLATREGMLWTAELVLYHVRGGQRQIADTDVLVEPEKLSTTEGDAGIQILESTSYPNGPFQLPELEEGDILELWVIAEMENGISLEQLVNAWTYLDGDFAETSPAK